jgi:hypothetical protein
MWVAAGMAAALAIGWYVTTRETMTDWKLDGATMALGREYALEAPGTVSVAGIGRLRLRAGSRLRILENHPERQRMELLAGGFDALIVAAPYVFQVSTPPARLDDLGCAYEVSLQDENRGTLVVKSGWVRVNARDEDSLVAQGYGVDLERGKQPGIPRRIDGGRDTLRLVHLLWRGESEVERMRAFETLAAMHPPPAGVTRERAARGDRTIVRDWWPTLGMGAEVKLPRIFYGE